MTYDASMRTCRPESSGVNQEEWIDRLWLHEREVFRLRAKAGLSAERSLDWLLLLSLARDWQQGARPDVASTTTALGLPRTTVKRGLDFLASRGAIELEQSDLDRRRRLIHKSRGFDALFLPLLTEITRLMIDLQEPLLETARRLSFALSDAVLITDAPAPGGAPKVLSANPGFTDLTGYSEGEILGRSPAMLQGEETDAAVRDEIRRAIDERRGTSGALTNYRKDGSAYPCHLTLSPLMENGEVRLFMGIARDLDAG